MKENPSVFPMGNELPEAFSKHFIGQAYLHPLTEKGGPISNVTFEPGCRNNWHIHHKGGQLVLSSGGRGSRRGRVQRVAGACNGRGVRKTLISLGLAVLINYPQN